MADHPELTRRTLLAGGGALAATALGGCAQTDQDGVSAASGAGANPSGAGAYETDTSGSGVEAFHGVHQAGVATAPQTHGAFLGFDLRKGATREDVSRLMRLLTDDARRLTQGRGALADTEPELAARPAQLTFTFGFGPAVLRLAGLKGADPLPTFKVDRLEERWSGGDLLVQICCDDPVTLAHALRMTVKDTRSFAAVRWVQRGFRQAPSGTGPTTGGIVEAGGGTQRNLMGQLDGTVNPRPGTPDFERAVWIADGPLKGGTMLVLRRIKILMDTWDAADRVAKEFTVGRRLDTGAPLTGTREHDEPDFAAVNAIGFPVIAEYAHIRRARTADPGMRMLRRVYNYEDGVESGLLFAAYQADVERQFTPVQRRLAEADLLNEWTRPIGSAVFAIPPGCGPDGWIGETLLA